MSPPRKTRYAPFSPRWAKKKAALLLLLAPLLAGCESESAALTLGNRAHALTLVRTKPYFWSNAWQLELVVARLPDCQRRHDLKKTTSETPRIEVYWSGRPGLFGLRHGKRWYAADTVSCDMQIMNEAPEDPGQFVGTFRVKNGTLTFEPADAEKASAGGEEAPANP